MYILHYYTSPTLVSYLIANKTHLCGTIKKNRKHFPNDLAAKVLDSGREILKPRTTIQYNKHMGAVVFNGWINSSILTRC